MSRRAESTKVQWKLAGGEVTVEVSLGSDSAVMTPEVAEELESQLRVHLGHIRRLRAQGRTPSA